MNKLLSHPKLILIVILVVTGLFATMLPNIVIDNDVKQYFPEDHPSYTRTEDLNDTFGSQIIMAIAITNNEGTILEQETLTTVKELVAVIEPMQFVEEVQAITNSDYPEGTAEGMKVAPLVKDSFNGSKEELRELRSKLLDWQEMYRRALYSDDFSSTQLIISIDEDISADEMSLLFNEIETQVDATVPASLEYRIAGDPVLSERAKEYMYSDLSRLIPLVILVVLMVLYFSFKSVRGTLLPLLTVLISTIWTLSIMSFLGIHFTVVSTCLPVLLIAVGSAYGIHVINHYYSELSSNEVSTSSETHHEMVVTSLKRVSKPVMLAGFTTIVGFSSITTSPIVPLKEFGIFSAIGVTFALLLALTFIPAMLLLLPPKTLSQSRTNRRLRSTERRKSILLNIYQFLSVRRWRIIGLTAVLIAVSTWGLMNINIESVLLEYFPAQSKMRQDTDFISDKFGGTNTFSIVLKGDEKNDVIKPEALKSMAEMETFLKARHPEIGKTLSFTDFIKRMNKIMNYPPSEEEAEEDESEAFAGSEEGFTDDSFTSFFEEESTDEVKKETSAAGESQFETARPTTPREKYNYEKYNEEITYAGFLELLNEIMTSRSNFNLTAEELTNEIARAFNYKGADYYEIPYNPEKYPVETREELLNLVSQYLLLYSGSLDNFSDDSLEPTQIRTSVQLKTHSTGVTDAIIKDVERYAAAHFPENYTVECTGIAEMENALTKMVTSSQVTSLLTALLIVFLIVAFSYRSPVAGLFGVVPLGLAILINFGIMGLTGIELDMITALVASIAIGIGVDYTIHFLNNYHLERLKSDDLELVTRNTLLLSGRAIIINALSVALGFIVLTLSEFIVLRYIGILIAIIMLTSSMAAMTILPVLLNTFKPAFISRPVKNRKSESAISGKEQNYA